MAESAVGSRDAALRNGRSMLGSDPASALRQADEMLRIDPIDGDALRLRAAALRGLGRHADAETAEMEAIRVSSHNPVLVGAAKAIMDNRLRDAEQLLRPHLTRSPDDVAAIRMLAEIAIRSGAESDGEEYLRRALQLAPAFHQARLALANLLLTQNRLAEGIEVLDQLLIAQPDDDRVRSQKAAALARAGDYTEALDIYLKLLGNGPNSALLWLSAAHIYKTLGKTDDAVSAYRRAIDLDPLFGEAWWSIANIKTIRFDDGDIAAMERITANPKASEKSVFNAHFGLGKAYEDRRDFARSFEHYQAGNDLRFRSQPYDPKTIAAQVDAQIATFTASFLAQHEGGSARPDPIFILGMPRAGSTLVEQILASHSMIEGTSELPHIPEIVRRLTAGSQQHKTIASLDETARHDLGEEYLRRAATHRKMNRPFFIDKLPNNWLYAPFIQLILPSAKIIDARRNPMDCCFSNYKQLFAQGHPYSYDLNAMGQYYADYVRMMAHIDAALPGRVHRVIHEALIDDSESEVRRLLAYIGVPFEEACLNFHENARAVRTASAEQVRRPINREGQGQWKNYELWLAPLRASLGSLVDRYPDL